MNITVALWILAWIAIVVVYLGLSAVLREVRMLRAQVNRLSASVSERPLEQLPMLPERLSEGAERVILASDSRCPLCRVTLARLGELGEHLPETPILLTHEDPAEWTAVPEGVRLVRDDAAWQQIAHLAPPVLMHVRADGTVRDLVLPSNEHDVDAAIARWSLQGVEE